MYDVELADWKEPNSPWSKRGIRKDHAEEHPIAQTVLGTKSKERENTIDFGY